MKLGDLEFHVLNDGTFRLDGGAFFGIIPKPIWERVIPADDRNRVTLSMNSLLIRTAGKWVLVETGAGDKLDAKKRDIYALEGTRLPQQLAQRGIRPEQIDFVINTHLHFDHCGWNTRVLKGKIVPTFPNARYVVHRGELDHARHPNERDRGSYFRENFEPVAEAGQWSVVDGNFEVAPGVEVVSMPGHNEHMMGVRLSGGYQTALFLADLIPTTAHIPLPWIMGFDLYPMQTLANKKKWLSEIAGDGWFALFGHDTKFPVALLQEREGKIVVEPVSVD